MGGLTASASKLHNALATRDADALQNIVTDDTLLHHGNSLPIRIKSPAGSDAVESAFSKTEFASAELLAAAIDEDEHTSFAFVWYKSNATEEASKSAAGEALTIWHAVWTADGAAVKELVAFTGDPAHEAFKSTPLDPADFARPGPSGGSGPGQDKVKAAIGAFCGLYDNADVDAVPRTLAENFAEWRPVAGKVKCGRENEQENLKKHGKYWKNAKTARHVAAADAGSGFLAWAALGHLAGADGTFDTSATPQLYTGLCFVLVDNAGLVTRSVHLDISEPKVAPLGWTGF